MTGRWRRCLDSCRSMPWSGLGWDPSELSVVVAIDVEVDQQLILLCFPMSLARIVFEMWNNAAGARFVRVLWGGQPIKTSTPLGTLSMVPLEDFLQVSDWLSSHSVEYRVELMARGDCYSSSTPLSRTTWSNFAPCLPRGVVDRTLSARRSERESRKVT